MDEVDAVMDQLQTLGILKVMNNGASLSEKYLQDRKDKAQSILYSDHILNLAEKLTDDELRVQLLRGASILVLRNYTKDTLSIKEITKLQMCIDNIENTQRALMLKMENKEHKPCTCESPYCFYGTTTCLNCGNFIDKSDLM